jgi:hypothetical protein
MMWYVKVNVNCPTALLEECTAAGSTAVGWAAGSLSEQLAVQLLQQLPKPLSGTCLCKLSAASLAAARHTAAGWFWGS